MRDDNNKGDIGAVVLDFTKRTNWVVHKNEKIIDSHGNPLPYSPWIKTFEKLKVFFKNER